MKYLIDQNGDIFTANIPSGGFTPDQFKDITDDIVFDAGCESLRGEHLEAIFVPEVPAVEGVPEHWADGDDIVYDANDIPTLVDGDGNPYLDPAYIHVDEVEAQSAVPSYYRVKKKDTADQTIRQRKIDELSVLRQPLLVEADVEINKLEDASGDSSAWRTYRQALRDITEPYKDENGDWLETVDSIIVEEFVFPVKP